MILNVKEEFFILSNWFFDNYKVLNLGKCLFMLLGVKENEQFDVIFNDITLKTAAKKKF